MASNPEFRPRPIHQEKELVAVFDTSDEAEALVV